MHEIEVCYMRYVEPLIPSPAVASSLTGRALVIFYPKKYLLLYDLHIQIDTSPLQQSTFTLVQCWTLHLLPLAGRDLQRRHHLRIPNLDVIGCDSVYQMISAERSGSVSLKSHKVTV